MTAMMRPERARQASMAAGRILHSMPRLSCRDDAAGAGAAGVDGGRQDIALDAEAELAVTGGGGVDDDSVRGERAVEEARHEGEATGDVGQSRVFAHAGTDEGGLGRHALALGGRALARVEGVDDVALLGLVDQFDGDVRDRGIAADDESAVVRKAGEDAL